MGCDDPRATARDAPKVQSPTLQPALSLRLFRRVLAPSGLAAERRAAAHRLCRGARSPRAALALRRAGRSNRAKSHHSALQGRASTRDRPYVTPDWPRWKYRHPVWLICGRQRSKMRRFRSQRGDRDQTPPHEPQRRVLERDDFSSNRHLALAYWWSMIFSGKPVSTPDQVRGRHFRDHAPGSVARWLRRAIPAPATRPSAPRIDDPEAGWRPRDPGRSRRVPAYGRCAP